MCGLLYYLSRHSFSEEKFRKGLRKISHRGPDYSGFGEYIKNGWCHHLGHNRLSIIDCDTRSNQPMRSKDGSVALVFNGEIYNYLELKKELEQKGHQFTTSGDSEVLLNCYLEYGEECIFRLEGMWSFVFTDFKRNVIFASRDPFGEKPLYYRPGRESFIIGSQTGAFFPFPEFRREISTEALNHYLNWQFIPAPHSIFAGCFQLEAGSSLHVKLKSSGDIEFYTTRYFNPYDYKYSDNSLSHQDCSRDALKDRFKKLLRHSVNLRMRSDVPLGAFLSGGVDSTLIVGMMKEFRRDVSTFTVGFKESSFNEAPVARSLAKYLGTTHHEKILTPDDLLREVGTTFDYWDEPFADSSQIATRLLSGFAREHVKVTLSGDGADELFHGYDRYNWTVQLSWWQRSLSSVKPLLVIARKLLLHHGSFLHIPSRQKIIRALDALLLKNPQQIFDYLSACFLPGEQNLILQSGIKGRPSHLAHPDGDDLYHNMALRDLRYYLSDNILVKLDRAAMAHSLESRSPFLDKAIFEQAVKLPGKFHRGPFGQKQILKDILCDYIPRSFIFRPKMGFALPLKQWLQGPLKREVQADLHPHLLARQGIFNPNLVKSTLTDFFSGRREHWYKIWNLWMFQKWWQRHMDDSVVR